MRLIHKVPLLDFVRGMAIDLPTPINISYLWNFGILLVIVLALQIITGLFLSMHYVANSNLAFDSVEHIMRDVNLGWLLRYGHANGASFFFIAMYIHIARGIYFGSYTRPRILLWNFGIIIFFLTMGTAFIGYVLPFGQMSFWGATVITNMVSAIPIIGGDIVIWLWGGYSVDNPTLNRFYSFHFLLPFVLLAVVILHVVVLHETGSNNPLGINSRTDKIPFHPYFTFKDIISVIIGFLLLNWIITWHPNTLGHTDNYIPSNPLVTPAHIVPEWYFLPFYAILRAIPNKLLGVIAMVLGILILAIMPFNYKSNYRGLSFNPLGKFFYWNFVFWFLILGWLGGEAADGIYVVASQIFTFLYFLYFLI